MRTHENPVAVLSEICRLLIRLGDSDSFGLTLALSHKIYEIIREENKSDTKPVSLESIFYIYKGIAQIGMNLTDIGVKNVLTGISGTSVSPADRSLGYRALTGAAIAGKNISMDLLLRKNG